MKRVEFVCDGCDSTESMTLPAARDIDFVLDGWVTHRIVAYENGSQAYEVSPDLCPKCSENLRRAINPANWPRMKASAQGFGGEPVRIGESLSRARRFAPYS